MAERAAEPAPSLRLVAGAADGYCDPVTGVCTLPGAVPDAVRADGEADVGAALADAPAGGSDDAAGARPA